MTTSLYRISSDDLPATLPIFPLYGVLLLPGGHLPLNIFEPRYVKMLDDALQSDRLIGMVQPRKEGSTSVYDVGCAGKVIEFTETADGRYEITLRGIHRFAIKEELKTATPYRRVQADWTVYDKDLSDEDRSCLGIDRNNLRGMVRRYFDKQGMNCDWDAFEKAPDMRIMSCLAMTCPFGAAEKQALLEQKCCHEQAQMFVAMLEMELYK